jgi:uncharacterized membrane protein
MVHAGGFYAMHGLGFGLGFLNLIGTILFFAFIFMVIKFFIKGGRYAAYRNWSGHESHGRGDWNRGDGGRGGWNRGAPWMRGNEGQGKGDFRPWHGNTPSAGADDEAMSVARERLAQGEINPEQFETIKGGLKVDMSDAPMGRHDKAVHLARLRFAKGEISLEEFNAVKKTLLS